MAHCKQHGEYDFIDGVVSGGCPECREAENKADRDRADTERYREEAVRDAAYREEAREEAARERAERAAEQTTEQTYRINNPGEYECPYCMMISLKRKARRCPKCQHDIEMSDWESLLALRAEILRQEAEARKRQEEERARKEQEEKAHEELLKARSNAGRLKALVSLPLVILGLVALFRVGNDSVGIVAAWSIMITGFVFAILAIGDFKHGNHRKGRGCAITSLWIGGILFGLSLLDFLLHHGI